jgi:hypothetical protein
LSISFSFEFFFSLSKYPLLPLLPLSIFFSHFPVAFLFNLFIKNY